MFLNRFYSDVILDCTTGIWNIDNALVQEPHDVDIELDYYYVFAEFLIKSAFSNWKSKASRDSV